MPILPPDYLSSWYFLRDGAGYVRIFENWSETQEQEVDKIALIQGDIGPHVMHAGGIKWVTSIESPALIVEFTDGGEGITDSFDLLVYAFDFLRNPDAAKKKAAEKNKEYIPDYLLQSGRISIGQEGVKVSMEIISSQSGAFAPQTILTSFFTEPVPPKPTKWPIVNDQVLPDFFARLARFYDVTFYTADSTQLYSFQVLSADIRINATISENYFVNTGSQSPYFGVQGYYVSGELELAVPPEYFPDVYLPEQNTLPVVDGKKVLQALNASKADINLLLAGRTSGLSLGSTQLRSKVNRSLNPNQISKVNVSFETFAHYTS